MKKRKALMILIATLAMICALALTGCGPRTLEDYAASNPDTKEYIDQMASTGDLAVEIKGNDVIYTYDISKISGVTEELAKSEDMKAQLASGLEAQKGSFETLVTGLEKETKFDNVRIIVKYTYNGEELISQTFES